MKKEESNAQIMKNMNSEIFDVGFIIVPVCCMVSKGKAIPLQAWTGPEGSRRLRLPGRKTIGT